MKELTEMSIPELEALNKELVKEINKKRGEMTFWDEVDELAAYQRTEELAGANTMQFREYSKFIKPLKDVGFTTIIHEYNNSVSIINYQKDKKDNEYYGFELKKIEGVLYKTREDVTEDDFELIKTILNIKQ